MGMDVRYANPKSRMRGVRRWCFAVAFDVGEGLQRQQEAPRPGAREAAARPTSLRVCSGASALKERMTSSPRANDWT